MKNKEKVVLKKIEERMKLKLLTKDAKIEDVYISIPEINRPALPLAGFFERFDNDRIQVIGNVEYCYLKTLTKEERLKRYEQIFSRKIPCIIYCRNLVPEDEVLSLANYYEIPIFNTNETTSSFLTEIIPWLKIELAPTSLVHGVMVDVYGEGVLIIGKSGIGKSEAALELIKRGHRLVTDDAVSLKRISDETLIGTAPDVTQYFMELRGVGVINIKTLYGVASVIESQKVDMVIKLVDWDEHDHYDRLGLEENYKEYMGNKIFCYKIPVSPGRNIATIIEAAAINHRQKQMGYNAAKELYDRIQTHNGDENDNE